MSFIDVLTDAIKKAGNLSGYARAIKTYVVKAFSLDQERAFRDLENTAKYLELVGQLEKSLREAGCSEDQIVLVITELKIPAVQAELEALQIARKIRVKSELKSIQTNKAEPIENRMIE